MSAALHVIKAGSTYHAAAARFDDSESRIAGRLALAKAAICVVDAQACV